MNWILGRILGRTVCKKTHAKKRMQFCLHNVRTDAFLDFK
jgi:hypothetical protein